MLAAQIRLPPGSTKFEVQGNAVVLAAFMLI
jgi:hypothetical protein